MKSVNYYNDFINKNMSVLCDNKVFLNYLKFVTRFPEQSYLNQVLLFFQNPTSKYVLPASAWKMYGREVVEDEPALAVINPTITGDNNDKVDENGNLLDLDLTLSYNIGYVYDVTQTEGNDSIILTKYHLRKDKERFIKSHISRVKNPLLKEALFYMFSYIKEEEYDTDKLFSELSKISLHTSQVIEFLQQLQNVFSNVLKEVSDYQFSYEENYILNVLLEEPVEQNELLYKLSSIKVVDNTHNLQKSIDYLIFKIKLINNYDKFLDNLNI